MKTVRDILSKVKDASGHEHAADGKFGSGGGSGDKHQHAEDEKGNFKPVKGKSGAAYPKMVDYATGAHVIGNKEATKSIGEVNRRNREPDPRVPAHMGHAHRSDDVHHASYKHYFKDGKFKGMHSHNEDLGAHDSADAASQAIVDHHEALERGESVKKRLAVKMAGGVLR